MADAKLTALTGVGVPALADLLYLVDVSDATDDPAGSSRSLTLDRLFGLAGVRPGGRLTTEANVSVSTADRAAQSTLRYTPHESDYLRLYDGSRVREYAFGEFTLSLTGLTAGKNYDVFAYDSSGSPALELSAAWTTDTARADAVAWQAGLGWVKSGTPTRLLLGTVRASGTTTTEDTARQRLIGNAYNLVRRRLARNDSTTSWTYNSTTARQARADASNQVEAVACLPGPVVDLTLRVEWVGDSGRTMLHSIGLDTTTTQSANAKSTMYLSGNSDPIRNVVREVFQPIPGWHRFVWLEEAGNANATTNYGGARSGLQGFTDA